MSDQEPPPVGEDPTREAGETTLDGGDTPDASVPFERLGDFEILRELGRGGMGVVYDARQISLKRRVALKVLPPGLGLTEQAVQRFEREAQAAAKLHHTNIVPVYATGAEQGCHYYAMELVEGPSLAQLLADAQQQDTRTVGEETLTRLFDAGGDAELPSTPSEVSSSTSRPDASTTGRKWFDAVARQLADVADALNHAHDRGVIHRDIKPANLLLSPEGRLCITDFGLARVAREPGVTTTGSFLGTPAYMSPEQARGKSVDHRADIYSLGVVLYEMLTLCRPFSGDSWEKVVQAILTRDPTVPRRINPRIPLDLETICQKAMEKDPDRRYQDAGAFANDLRQYLQRGLITARRAGPIRKSAKWIRRHPLATVTTAAVVVVIAVVGIAWSIYTKQTAESARRAVADAQLAMNYGDYRGALARVDEALTLDPDLVDARLIRARLLVKLWRTAEAVEEANALLEKAPDDWRVHLIVAGVARAGDLPTISAREHIELAESRAPETADAYYLRSLIAERPVQAIELLDRALELDPAYIEALVERTHRHDQMKDFPAALRDCDRLIYSRPRSAEGYRNKASILRRSGDPLGALSTAEQAVELDPEDPVNYASRGQANLVLGRHREAIEDISRAIELYPVNAPYHWMRASWRVAEGLFEEAIADSRQALALNPDYLVAYYPLMNAHLKLGRTDEVRQILSEVAAASAGWADPGARAEVHLLIASYSASLGDPERAVAEVTDALELDSDNLDALFFRANLRGAMEDESGVEADCDAAAGIVLDESREPGTRLRVLELGATCDRYVDAAVQGLDRLIEEYPGWWEPYGARTQANMYLGRLEAALEDSNKVIELAPRYSAGYVARQVINFQMGRPSGDDFEKALEWNPYDTTLRMNIADSDFNSGDLEASLAQLDRILELDPLHAPAHGMRGRVFAYRGMCEEAKQALDRAREVSTTIANPRGYGIAQIEAWVQTVVYGCPDDYDPASAVEGARALTEASPGDPAVWNHLGAALYFDGRHEESKTALLKAVELRGKAKAGDLLLLSMASFQLGDRVDARTYYDRAVAEMGPDSRNPFLINYHRDASRLLGVR